MRPLQGVRLALLVLLASLPGCTTLSRVDGPVAEVAHDLVEPGDEVRITTINDEVYELEVTELNSAGITGVERGKKHTVPYAAIVTLEVSQVDWGRTIATPVEIGMGIVQGVRVAIAVVGLMLVVIVVIAG